MRIALVTGPQADSCYGAPDCLSPALVNGKLAPKFYFQMKGREDGLDGIATKVNILHRPRL